MKKIAILLTGLLIVFAFMLIMFKGKQISAEDKPGYVKGELLVKFKENVSAEEISDTHRKLGGKVKSTISGLNVQVIEVNKGVGEMMSAYAKSGRVEYAEPDYIAYPLTNDVYFNRQWGMNNTGQQTCNMAGDICTTGTPDADIDAPEAWNITTGNSAIKIAILDSGIDQNHPDLMNKVVANANFSDSNTVDDLYGHGTHVAGIAAATTGNDTGVAGVGYQAVLMNGKVLNDTGYGAYSWIANGITWAADGGAKVINLSVGNGQRSSTLEAAVNYAWNKGAVVVAAAGNSANPSKTYPAYYTNCIAVAATNNNDVMASFSSYGSWVDVAAPGENVFSTFPNHPFYLQSVYGRANNYDFGNGTSMSVPHVSGIAALVWATSYGTNAQSVRNRIEQTADSVPGTGTYWVWGRVNACNAVGGNCSAAPTPTPTPSPTPAPNACSNYCFRSVCDGVCTPKDKPGCPDCL